MPVEATTGLYIPTLEEFATFKGFDAAEDFDEPESQIALFLSIAADLLILRTGLKKAPQGDTPVTRMVSYGIMDLAWFLGTTSDEWTSMFSPFSSERIGSYTYCVDDKTEILTQRGWKQHYDLLKDDLVYTLNSQTGMSEWQPLVDVHRFSAMERDMLLVESSRFSSLTTMNHRWLTQNVNTGKWRWRKTKDFVESVDGTSVEAIPFNAPYADAPKEQVYSDALVELVAWYWTEGSKDVVRTRSGGGHIHQSYKANSSKCAMIRAASTELFGRASETLRPEARKTCRQEGCDEPTKARGYCNPHYMEMWRWHKGDLVVPRIHWTEGSRYDGEMAVFSYSPEATRVITDHLNTDGSVKTEFLLSLTKAQLELFIEVSVLADGCKNRDKQLTQKEKSMAEQFALACILSGRRVSITQTKSGAWCVGYGRQLRTKLNSYKETVKRVLGTKTKFEVVKHQGMVWCPQTLNGTWLAKRDGKVYFTGNSKSVSAAQSKRDLLDAPLFDAACHALLNSEQEEVDSGIRHGIGFDTEHVFPQSFHESNYRDTFPGRTSRGGVFW